MLGMLITMFALAAKSAPIERKGNFCPIGYYRMATYCMPFQRTTEQALPRTSKNCPIGSYTQSNYCLTGTEATNAWSDR